MTEPILRINEVYGPVPQGEGPTLGQPSIFLRLAGCNLDCHWCDTPYSWDWKNYYPAEESHPHTVPEAVAVLTAYPPGYNLTVTGGEPLLQARTLGLVLAEVRGHFRLMELETNSTREPPPWVHILDRVSLSPKLANSRVAASRRILPAALAAWGRAYAEGLDVIFKPVVESAEELGEVAEFCERLSLPPDAVYVMPEGTDPETILRRMTELSGPVAAAGYNLTTRLHVLTHGQARRT
jgi:organic radical activating enzyme